MAARQARLKGRVVQIVALSIIATVSWMAAIYFRIAPDGAPLLRSGRAAPSLSSAPVRPPEPGTAAPTGSAVATARSTAETTAPADSNAVASASPSDSASADSTTTASSEASAAPAAGGDAVLGCVAKLFPEDTFQGDEVDFGFLCTATAPRKTLVDVQSQVVAGRAGRGGVTKGMRMWSHLNWYRLGAIAVLRGRCCESAEPFEWSMDLPCPFNEAVAKLEEAVRADDRAGIEGALGYYTTTARCLAKAGMSRAFEFSGAPGTGALLLRKMIVKR